MYQSYFDLTKLLPLANEVWGKVIFSEVCVKNSVHGGGGGIPACIAGGIPACLAAGLLVGVVVSQHALQVSRGEVSRPTPRGEVEGSGWEGVSRPTPKGGSPSPHRGGVSRPTPGGGVSQHALRQTSPVDGYCRGRYASYWNAFLLN